MVLPPYNTPYVQQVILLCMSDSGALMQRNTIKTDIKIVKTAPYRLIGVNHNPIIKR